MFVHIHGIFTPNKENSSCLMFLWALVNINVGGEVRFAI